MFHSIHAVQVYCKCIEIPGIDSISAFANITDWTKQDQIPLIRDDFGVRKITIGECLAFQGFPDEFKFPKTVTINDAYKQIGNSVCVPVIKRIAEKIKEIA